MSIRQSTFRSGFKDNQQTTDVKTHRKNQYSFASPFRNSNQKSDQFSQLKFRSPLREQQIHDYNRIKTQLKKGLELAKQNISLNQSTQFVHIDEYNALNSEYKYETERLLFEIEKLHETIYEVERVKNNEIQKLKQEYQQITYLNMSNVRQGHNAQVEMLQTQLRKTKQILSDKTSQFENVIKRQQRQIKHLNNETSRLNSEIRAIIQQKNSQLQHKQKSTIQRIKNIKQQYENKHKQMSQVQQKQINRISRLLQNRDKKLQLSKQNIQLIESENNKLEHEIQLKRIQVNERIQQVQEQSKQKYNRLRQIIKSQSNEIIIQIRKNYEIKQQVLQNEIRQLKKFLIYKNEDRQKLIKLHQQRLLFVNDIKKQIQKQNQQLKNKIYSINLDNMKQLQLLKVKMAALHQGDINILVKTYQTKLQSFITQNKQKQQTINRLRKNIYQQTNHRYEIRKKYSIQISKLNQKIIKLRSGLAIIQTDMKQKLQNQKSMMLLTSRNIIKDVQAKTSNSKFYQIQLQKLQNTIRNNDKNMKQNQNQVQQKILIVQSQLQRLSKHIITQKTNHKQTQSTYKQILKNKDNQINLLKLQINNIQHNQFNNNKQLLLIQQLKNQLHSFRLQNAKLKDQSQLLQSKINIMKAQLDQYQIEHQITHQQAKKQYQKISHQNMDQFQKFYQSRISSLQKQKQQLKQLISSKQQKITSLVQKYQQLQTAMKSTLKNIKKRTQLQNKVINLGTDNNLIKNMVQIVKNNMKLQS